MVRKNEKNMRGDRLTWSNPVQTINFRFGKDYSLNSRGLRNRNPRKHVIE